jgi:hypothetical protein
MRINEITDQNKIWKNLMDFNFEFTEEYKNAEQYAQMVLSVKHKNKYLTALELIHVFNKRANDFLSAKPFDPNDSDIISLRQQVKNMVARLYKLEQQLK